MAELKQIKINNVDVSADVRTYFYDEFARGEIAYFEGEFKSSLTTTHSTLQIGQTIEVQEGWLSATENRVFKGPILNISKTSTGYKIVAHDMMHHAISNQVTALYDSSVHSTAGVVSEIAKDLVNNYTPLTADSVSVQNSGTENVLPLFPCDGADVYERLKALANAIEYQVYYCARDDKVHFEEEGFEDNTGTIFVGGANSMVSNVPEWQEDLTEIINEVALRGATISTSNTESFNGDGSTTDFTLEFEPTDVKVSVDSGSGFVEQTGGIEDSTETFDYSLDVLNKKVKFVTAPVTGTNNVQVEYFYLRPTTVLDEEEDSKTQYGITSARTFTFSDIPSVADMEIRARSILEKRAYAPEYTTLQIKPSAIRELDVWAGQRIGVVDTINDKNVSVIVVAKRTHWPDRAMELQVSTKLFNPTDVEEGILARLKRLEEGLAKNTDLLNIPKRFKVDVGLKPYAQAQDLDLVNDSFIADHPDNGVADNGAVLDILDTGASGWTTSDFTLTNFSREESAAYGTALLKIESASAQTGTLTTTQSMGDISDFTGVSSGTPTKGTCGLWTAITPANFQAAYEFNEWAEGMSDELDMWPANREDGMETSVSGKVAGSLVFVKEKTCSVENFQGLGSEGTISFWIKRAATSASISPIITKGGTGTPGSNTHFSVYVNSFGNVLFEIGNGISTKTSIATTGNELNDTGVWHFIVASYTNSTISLYVDDMTTAAASGSHSITAASSAAELRFGRWAANEASYHLDAELDAMKLRSKEITLAERQAEYNSGAGQSFSGLALSPTISSVTLRLGSDSSNYAEMTSRTYHSDLSGYGSETQSFRNGKNLCLFDLDTATITGTPDWTAVAYARLEITFDEAAEIYIDFLSVSASNNISYVVMDTRTTNQSYSLTSVAPT